MLVLIHSIMLAAMQHGTKIQASNSLNDDDYNNYLGSTLNNKCLWNDDVFNVFNDITALIIYLSIPHTIFIVEFECWIWTFWSENAITAPS